MQTYDGMGSSTARQSSSEKLIKGFPPESLVGSVLLERIVLSHIAIVLRRPPDDGAATDALTGLCWMCMVPIAVDASQRGCGVSRASLSSRSALTFGSHLLREPVLCPDAGLVLV